MNAEQTKNLVLKLYANQSLTVKEITRKAGIGTLKLAKILKEANVPRRDESGLRRAAAELRPDRQIKPVINRDVEGDILPAAAYEETRALTFALLKSAKNPMTFNEMKKTVTSYHLYDAVRSLIAEGLVEESGGVRLHRYSLKESGYVRERKRDKHEMNAAIFSNGHSRPFVDYGI